MFASLRTLCLLGALLLPFSAAMAGDIPYGVKDKTQLNATLKQAEQQLAAHENEKAALVAAGIACHQLAALRVDGAADKAVDYLQQATALEPGNNTLLAYLGSAYAMAGRDSSFVVMKVSKVNKGLAILDKAQRKDPANLDVRFIRASVQYSVPGMFSRKSQAADDYLFFAEHAPPAGEGARLAEAYFKLGKNAQENHEAAKAKGFFEKSRASAPDSDWSRQADRALK